MVPLIKIRRSTCSYRPENRLKFNRPRSGLLCACVCGMANQPDDMAGAQLHLPLKGRLHRNDDLNHPLNQVQISAFFCQLFLFHKDHHEQNVKEHKSAPLYHIKYPVRYKHGRPADC